MTKCGIESIRATRLRGASDCCRESKAGRDPSGAVDRPDHEPKRVWMVPGQRSSRKHPLGPVERFGFVD